jgi:hypothetical protein
MENISMQTQEKPQTQPENQAKEQAPSITSVPITDEITALNVLVQFAHIAQKRGAFNMQESAKLWECISKFMKTEQ